MWQLLSWVAAFVLIGAAALTMYLNDITSGPAVWGMMAVCAALFIRMAMLAVRDEDPPPGAPRPAPR